MKKVTFDKETAKAAVKYLGWKYEKIIGVIAMKDGGKMTATIEVYDAGTGNKIINISNAVAYVATEAEYEKFMKRVTRYKNEKAQYVDGMGMTEEAWNAWNGEDEEV